MYGDDLVILGESFRRDKEFYSVFSAPTAANLGKAVETFYTDSHSYRRE